MSKQEIKDWAEKAQNDMHAKFDEIESKIDASNDKAKADFHDFKAKLHRQNHEFKQKVDNWNDDNEEKWNAFKDKTKADYDELRGKVTEWSKNVF